MRQAKRILKSKIYDHVNSRGKSLSWLKELIIEGSCPGIATLSFNKMSIDDLNAVYAFTLEVLPLKRPGPKLRKGEKE